MRALLTVLGLAVVAGSACPAYALDANELVTRHVDALGGRKNLDALRSLRMTGKISFLGGGSTFELAWSETIARPGKVREEASLQGLTAVSVLAGSEGWAVEPFSGRRDASRSAPEDTKELARAAELGGPLAAARPGEVTYLGTEDVDGTPAHKLEVRQKNGDYLYVFLDPDYLLIIRVETHDFLRGSESVAEIDFGNYESVAGVWIPFSIEQGPKNGPRNVRRTVEKAEANFEVDDALFRFPEKGKAMDVPLPKPAPTVVLPGSSKAPVMTRAAAEKVRLDAGVLSGLGARNIGSAAMSGRVSAVAARTEGGMTTVFVGAASGGVWKSLDGGTTFKPVFDHQRVQSIGAVGLDPSDPKIVWVGTGEAWTRNSVSVGDGIYKSTDGGETWKNVGLPESERITKIVVHPKNGDIVYACVPGKLWSDSADRGLYKTADGGKTWSLVLAGKNLSTGCSGVSLDPRNPDVILAGLWDFRRKGWSFRSGGDGPTATSGSGLFSSLDGGKTWTELTPKANAGLPPKPWGRIEVTHAPSDGKVVYAFIEGVDSALFASSDGGKTWEARDKSQNMVWRPFYFARLVVDPVNAARLFKAGGGLIVSENGGRSFSSAMGGSHGDWHDLWIDPTDPKHVIGGDDGGLWISTDGGSRWWKCDNLPISQFYHVSADDRDPYQVYGGLQDNSSWVGDSDYPDAIGNDRWNVLYYGDGFWTFVDPSDPDAVYAEYQGGHIARMDRRTRAARDIQPTAGYKEKLRFNWNTPIHLSPNSKGTIYVGAQFLFRSKDRGDTWERLSPDLTTNDPQKQKQEESGGITVDNSSAEMHTSIYSISESPKKGGLIWVGTDDGNIQVTRDGGKSWTNVTPNLPRDLPANSWVSWVEASRFDEGTAYATFDRHTFGDLAPYVYETTDLGKTWTRIAGPEQGLRGYAHVVKEDSVEKRILFVGTEFGLWITIDGGATWAAFEASNFPAVAVRDLVVQPRAGDLVIGTHGRGIWIVDDLTPLRALSGSVLGRDLAFLPSRPVEQRMSGIGSWVDGDAKFRGQGVRGGALAAYYQKTRHLFGPLELEVLGPDGKLVDKVAASKRRGINRVSWPMRFPPPRVPRAAQLAYSASQGPRVLPGTYQLRLKSGRDVHTAKLEIRLDRRAPYSARDRKAQLDAAMRVHALFGRMTDVVERIDRAHGAAERAAEKVAEDEVLEKKLRVFLGQLEVLKKEVVATKEGGAITGEERIREHTDELYGALVDWEGRPAKYKLERIVALTRELEDVEKGVDALFSAEVPALDRELEKRGLPVIPTKKVEHAEVDLPSSDLRRAFGAFLGREAWHAAEAVERD